MPYNKRIDTHAIVLGLKMCDVGELLLTAEFKHTLSLSHIHIYEYYFIANIQFQ